MCDSCSCSTDISHKVITQCSTLKFFLSNKSWFFFNPCNRRRGFSSRSNVSSEFASIHRKWTCLGVLIAANQNTPDDYVTPKRGRPGVFEIFHGCYKIYLDNISSQCPKIKQLFFLHLDKETWKNFIYVIFW